MSFQPMTHLLAILEAHKAGLVALVASKLVHDEISKAPLLEKLEE
jgi:hypothetical protein